MKKLKVIIGGFPNSGTSFLTNLIVKLGYSPGNQENLKQGDTHNRWGYFEHLVLRKLVHSELGLGQFKGWMEDFNKINYNNINLDAIRNKVIELAIKDSVEVVKDNALPLTFQAYPENGKYIIIQRNPRDIYDSPKKAGYRGYPFTFNELKKVVTEYQKLTKQMIENVDLLVVKYEEFENSFADQLKGICDFLEREYPVDISDLKAIYRPRKKIKNWGKMINKIKVLLKI